MHVFRLGVRELSGLAWGPRSNEDLQSRTLASLGRSVGTPGTRQQPDAFADLRRLEHEGDRITREALASLFTEGVDPMVVIRWKDIFDRLEEAIDGCKRVSNVLQGIVVKQS